MILLCHPTDLDPAPLARVLEGASLAVFCISPREVSAATLPVGIDRGVLVFPGQSLVQAGEQVGRLRSRLNGSIPVLLCCPQVTPPDRELLTECGASTIITPSTWELGAIAERIVSELILAGEIEPSGLGSLKGATRGMQEVYRRIETLAPLDEPVLVLGETGCGKELVAREVHRLGGRRGELLAINCAALTPELLESELFGHERGAFSGAVTRRQGLLKEAGKGTVFLDEIGDLDLVAQAKLLRALDEKKVRPVGSNSWQPFEARLVFATNRNLDEARKRNEFRADLHERLRGFSIILPPLRERRADLPILVHHFLAEYNRDYPGQRTMPPGAIDPLFRYSWPGNVRELRLAVREAAAYAPISDGPLSIVRLQEVVQRDFPNIGPYSIVFDPAIETWRQVHDRVRNSYFRAVLAEVGGQKDAASRKAGISRSQFYEILKQIGDSRSES